MPKKPSSKLRRGKNSRERGLGVLLERMDGKVDLLVEGHKTLDRKVDILHGEMNERFKVVNYKLELVFEELHVIRNELKEKVGRDEFVFLEKRVARLEKRAHR